MNMNFGFQNFSAGFLSSQFSHVNQMFQAPSMMQVGAGQLYNIANQFAQLATMGMQQTSFQRVTGFAAMPDFNNAGQLEADPKSKTVTTPGGFKIKVDNGMVKIQNPNGKWTTVKAEPPGRTVTSKTTGKQTRTTSTLERVLPRDPAVRESDGDVWRYQGLGTFKLPDGTKIRINEVGKGKDLHIDQVDIYNGNKHVSVKSQLTSSKYKTVKTTSKTQFGPWRNVSTRRQRRGRAIFRNTTQQRTSTTTHTHQQVADQKFKTTMSTVKNDGWMHDAMNKDGEVFNLAGKTGEAWSQGGRELMSGAGKGKDDKKLKFKLGNDIANSQVGARQLQVPWKFAAFDAMVQTQNTLNMFNTGFMGGNAQNFLNIGQQPHLGAFSNLANWNNMQSVFAGPFGGASMFGNMHNQAFNPMQLTQNLFSAVNNLNSFFNNQATMNTNLSAMMFTQFRG